MTLGDVRTKRGTYFILIQVAEVSRYARRQMK
ncbi:hypothetical protein FHT70_000302 [Rhizobium sp. BK049]|nr:hypothetical protein [Rhizobium sp. BK049]